MSRSFLDLDVEMGVENGRMMAFLAAHGEILSKKYHDTRVVVHCRIPQRYLGAVERDGAVIQPHHNRWPHPPNPPVSAADDENKNIEDVA